MMLSRAVTEGLDTLYPLRVLAGSIVLWYYWITYFRGRVFQSAAGSRKTIAEPPSAMLQQWPSNSAYSWKQAVVPAGIGLLVFLLWIAIPTGTNEQRLEIAGSSPMTLPPLLASGWLLFRVAGAVVIVPIVEELAFRGYLLRRLQSADFSRISYADVGWLAVLGSAVAFGLLHGRWLAGTLAGGLYAVTAMRRGQLFDSIIAHAVTNLLLAGYVISTSQWSYWG
jgi:CAAX prenyl protease-like protein